MRCLHPIEVREWYDALDGTKKRSAEYHLVPCGKCVACLSLKRNNWSYRLAKEQLASSYSYFLTLTYDNDQVPIRVQDGKPYFVFNKKHVQDYLKRVRYFAKEMNPNLVLRYYCVSEYGSKTLRPHYHMQLFVQNDNGFSYKKTIESILEKEWTYGYFQRKPTSPANIHYVTKYCIKTLEELPPECIDPVFILCSKKPYLGESACKDIENQGDPSKVFLNGYFMPLPRIYRQKADIEMLPNVRQDSYDPRISPETYLKMRQEYIRTHDKFDLPNFTIYCNNRLAGFEADAVRRQLTRQEKL